jgi:hypothetical protein
MAQVGNGKLGNGKMEMTQIGNGEMTQVVQATFGAAVYTVILGTSSVWWLLRQA